MRVEGGLVGFEDVENSLKWFTGISFEGKGRLRLVGWSMLVCFGVVFFTMTSFSWHLCRKRSFWIPRNFGFGSGNYHLSPVYKAQWLQVQVPGWGETQYSLWYLWYNRYTRQITDVCNDELYKAIVDWGGCRYDCLASQVPTNSLRYLTSKLSQSSKDDQPIPGGFNNGVSPELEKMVKPGITTKKPPQCRISMVGYVFFRVKGLNHQIHKQFKKMVPHFFGFFCGPKWFRYQNLIHESFGSFGVSFKTNKKNSEISLIGSNRAPYKGKDRLIVSQRTIFKGLCLFAGRVDFKIYLIIFGSHKMLDNTHGW